MSYRLGDPNPVYVNLLGSDTVAGGSLQFYDKGTTTPKATYSDEGLTTPNANPLNLDVSGRASTQVWLTGDYTVLLYDGPLATGDLIWTRDVVAPVPASTGLPDPSTEPGGTLKSNGSAYELVLVTELPDPTDSAGMMVVVNGSGTGYTLQEQPEIVIPEPDIEVGTATVVIGDGAGERFMAQYGAFTVPTSGSRTSNVSVTFPLPFTKVWAVIPSPETSAVNSYGAGATMTASGFTAGSPATGATITANIADDGGGSGDDIVNPVLGTYMAFGLVAAA